MVLAVPFGVARRLEPSPLGMGTHQQLGLPPCTFRLVVGKRCPSCGMTTSWAHVVRGQVVSALRASVSGTLLAALGAGVCVCSLLSAMRGRWVVAPPREMVWICGGGVLLLVIFLEWAWRLAAG